MASGGASLCRWSVWRSALALALAVLFLGAVSVADWHGHSHAPDACVVCHAGHLFGLAETSLPGIDAPGFLVWVGIAAELLVAPQAVPALTRSRAPPA